MSSLSSSCFQPPFCLDLGFQPLHWNWILWKSCHKQLDFSNTHVDQAREHCIFEPRRFFDPDISPYGPSFHPLAWDEWHYRDKLTGEHLDNSEKKNHKSKSNMLVYKIPEWYTMSFSYFLTLDEMILNSVWQNLMKRVVRASYWNKTYKNEKWLVIFQL